MEAVLLLIEQYHSALGKSLLNTIGTGIIIRSDLESISCSNHSEIRQNIAEIVKINLCSSSIVPSLQTSNRAIIQAIDI